MGKSKLMKSDLLKAHNAGLTVPQICKKFGVSRQQVYIRLQRLNITPNWCHKKKNKRSRELARVTVMVNEIAAQKGCQPNQVVTEAVERLYFDEII